MEDKFEGDGATVEEAEVACKHSLPLISEGCEDVWCKKTHQICYLYLDEKCEEYEPIVTPIA